MWLYSLAMAQSCEVVVVCDGTTISTTPIPMPAPVCDTDTDADTDSPPGDTGAAPTGDTGGADPVPARIVVILLDDVGAGVLSDQTPAAHPEPMAPHLDALAAGGARFSRAYAAPLCSPSRAALMTGREGTRDGVDDWASPIHIPALEAAWPHAFVAAGWSTAYRGKWNLTGIASFPGVPTLRYGRSPGVAGFADWEAVENAVDDGAFLVALPDNSVVERTGPTAPYWLGSGLDWLAAQSGPAVLMVGLGDAHTPWVAPAADWDGLDHVTATDFHGFWAEVRAADRAIGDFVAGLDALGMLDDTLLIVTSDNGVKEYAGYQGYPNGDGFGWKGTVLEGGSRVPFVVHWPAGGVSGVVDAPISFADIGHYLTARAGVPWAHLEPTDGEDFGPSLTGPWVRQQGIPITRPNGDRGWISADGSWKYERIDGAEQVLDLTLYPRGDTAVSDPAMLAALRSELAAWEASDVGCASYPGGDCGPVAQSVWWYEAPLYAPYYPGWCSRPEYDGMRGCD